MRGSERSDAMCGPVENMSQAYFAGIDRVAKAYEPTVNGLSRCNLEIAGLAARRARAWFDIPSTLGRCKTPQDLLGEQTKFWQTAFVQYTETWQRLTAMVGTFAVIPGANGAFGGKTTAARDFITFPDAPERTEPSRGERRAA
jgi:hypothetical protein